MTSLADLMQGHPNWADLPRLARMYLSVAMEAGATEQQSVTAAEVDRRMVQLGQLQKDCVAGRVLAVEAGWIMMTGPEEFRVVLPEGLPSVTMLQAMEQAAHGAKIAFYREVMSRGWDPVERYRLAIEEKTRRLQRVVTRRRPARREALLTAAQEVFEWIKEICGVCIHVSRLSLAAHDGWITVKLDARGLLQIIPRPTGWEIKLYGTSAVLGVINDAPELLPHVPTILERVQRLKGKEAA